MSEVFTKITEDVENLLSRNEFLEKERSKLIAEVECTKAQLLIDRANAESELHAVLKKCFDEFCDADFMCAQCQYHGTPDCFTAYIKDKMPDATDAGIMRIVNRCKEVT